MPTNTIPHESIVERLHQLHNETAKYHSVNYRPNTSGKLVAIDHFTPKSSFSEEEIEFVEDVLENYCFLLEIVESGDSFLFKIYQFNPTSKGKTMVLMMEPSQFPIEEDYNNNYERDTIVYDKMKPYFLDEVNFNLLRHYGCIEPKKRECYVY